MLNFSSRNWPFFWLGHILQQKGSNLFHRMDTLPATQPTMSKYWRNSNNWLQPGIN